MVEDEITTEENDWDPNFVKELNRRSRQRKRPVYDIQVTDGYRIKGAGKQSNALHIVI